MKLTDSLIADSGIVNEKTDPSQRIFYRLNKVVRVGLCGLPNVSIFALLNKVLGWSVEKLDFHSNWGIQWGWRLISLYNRLKQTAPTVDF